MAILITGGTGLVGRQLIEDLIEQGHAPDTIRALVRPQSDWTMLQAQGVRLYPGDVTDLESLKAASQAVHTIFHCAAAVDEKRKDLFWKINFEGTAQLLEAARRAAVSKFIQVSSIGVYGLLEKTPATPDPIEICHCRCPTASRSILISKDHRDGRCRVDHCDKHGDGGLPDRGRREIQ